MEVRSFDGMVKPLRRGGWSARGSVLAVRHGQLFEDQVGPREFPGRDDSIAWLTEMAAERSIPVVRITAVPERVEFIDSLAIAAKSRA